MRKVTKKTVQIFATALKEFLTSTGLGDWEVILEQGDCSEVGGERTLACVGCDLDNCVARFEINKKWPDTEPQDRTNIRKVALHEVLHVLLTRYDSHARDRYTTEQQLLDAEHDIIRRLIMLYTEMQGKGK